MAQRNPCNLTVTQVKQLVEDFLTSGEPGLGIVAAKYNLACRENHWVAIQRFMREEFRMNLRYAGKHNGEDDFEQV